MLFTDLQRELDSLEAQLVEWRRDFHMHPELGFQEFRSGEIIAEQLHELGFVVRTGVASTGVVGILEGALPGPVVMLRFDMDALPIQEENEVPYASQHPGVMHACGHDAHMAMGLGVATLAANHRSELTGTLMVVFQPGEEGAGGAERMIQEGVLTDPRPDVFLAAHMWQAAPVGTICVSPGPVMAAAEKWTCTVLGQGGHGALPHQAVDPIVAAAHVITAFQTVVSRNVSPLDAAVVTVGTIHAGDAFNVIPSEVTLTGTVRTYEPGVRDLVLERMHALVKGITASFGAQAELEFSALTPAVINDPAVTAVVRAAAEAVVGSEQVLPAERTMGSEDAAFFMQHVPGCYFFVGSSNPQRGLIAPHHNPRFDIDESALRIGVAVMMQAVAHYLGQKATP